jgi:agmatine deiminase
MNIRLPAEWEPQDGILLAWPHAASDWADRLDLVEPVFVEIARAASRYAKVLIAGPAPDAVLQKLNTAGIDVANIHLVTVATNDTWTRDYGALTVYENSKPQTLDFGFNGWGNKYPADLDDKVTATLADQEIFTSTPRRIEMILEGGSIDSDGKGTLLTTSRCLRNPNRNPGMSLEELSRTLAKELGINKILWLDSGFLAGDDTDSHVDILARFAPDDTILYVSCDDEDDIHFDEMNAMRRELETFRTRAGQSYRLLPLPLPAPKLGNNGERLAATYANFLVINDAVLVPTYDDPNDAVAGDTIAAAFPGREIIPINCLPLIHQGGSLHCSTMQLPKGTLA